MTQPTPSLSLAVDVRNPGQFFACCGLLELAHRRWPGAEGWFTSDDSVFNIHCPEVEACSLSRIVKDLEAAGVQGDLSQEERRELDGLERRKRQLGGEGKALSDEEEARRVELGKRVREGAVIIGSPFELRLAWWQEESDDIPKTFAGRQEVLRMARAMLAKAPEAARAEAPLEYRCLLRAGGENGEERSGGGQQSGGSKVEPFYFDARRFSAALDAGFSLDLQEKNIRAAAAPLTELLALIGLQRFRPGSDGRDKGMFTYSTWSEPLGVITGAAVACGAALVGARQGYRFRLQSRDGQNRYKAFGFAIPVEEIND